MHVQQNIQPPGGWRLPVKDNMPPLKAGSKQALIDLVYEWRLRNGLQPGNIDAEIDEFICTQYPRFCKQDKEVPDRSQTSMKPEARVSLFASTLARLMPRGGYTLLTKAEAEVNAKVCAGCPMNKSWSCGCRGQNSINQLLSAIRQMKTTTVDSGLGFCNVTGRELRTDVWLNSDSLESPSGEIGRLPPNCWKLKA